MAAALPLVLLAVGLPDSYDVYEALDHLATIAIAFVIAMPLGWDRERARTGFGLRTFPLVAVASCGFVLVLADDATPEANARLVSGLMAGIGFIGGGAILKKGDSVHGTATAAAIWATGALGGAVALGKYEVAVIVAVVTFATLRWAQPLARQIVDERDDDDAHTDPERRPDDGETVRP